MTDGGPVGATRMGGGLEATVAVDLGELHLDVSIDVAPGETVAVVGPNGAGKTTLLRSIAGLQSLDRGRVTAGGMVLEDVLAGVWVPPERRPVGVVFQDGRLFPHRTVVDNVAFGLRMSRRRMRRDAARVTAAAWIDRVGLAGLEKVRPDRLSGGQAQRVALARALAPEPAVLLLDEPLAALDASTRADMRRDLRRHLATHTGARLLVTHDAVDAAGVADRVVVLEAGRIVQEGSLGELAARPRTRYVADLVGTNLVRGRAVDGRVTIDGGASTGSGFSLVAADPTAGEVLLSIAPRAVGLSLSRPDGTARNVWEASVASVEHAGDRVRVAVRGPIGLVAEVTPAAVTDLALAPGTPVWVSVKATEIDVAPA